MYVLMCVCISKEELGKEFKEIYAKVWEKEREKFFYKKKEFEKGAYYLFFNFPWISTYFDHIQILFDHFEISF